MQLTPGKHLIRQVEHLSSTNLEAVVAATFASVGFYVMRDLKHEIGGQQAAQIDVFASAFSPLREQRLLLECKGGHPAFDELQRLSSFHKTLEPPPDELIMVCRAGCPGNREQLANDLDVSLIEKPKLVSYVLPMLGGGPFRAARARELNRYFAWQVVHDYLVGMTGLHPLLKQHYRFLTCELWIIGPPEQQLARSFDAYRTTFERASDKVATARSVDPKRIVYDAPDDVVEAAMYVMVLHRLMNAYALTRHTLNVMRRQPGGYLLATMGPSLRAAVCALSRKPRYLYGFPAFLQEFLFIWGGFLYMPEREWEVVQLAEACDTTPAAVEHYLEVITNTYSGPGGSMLGTWHDLTLFKYVPAAFRMLGVRHRQALNPAKYASVTFFPGAEPAYAVALDRALAGTGGTAGLKY